MLGLFLWTCSRVLLTAKDAKGAKVSQRVLLKTEGLDILLQKSVY